MTNNQKFTLYFSGGCHITSTDNRIEDLPVDPESVDIVFEEDVTHDPPISSVIVTNWLATLLLCLALQLYLLGLSIASRLGLADSGIVDALEDAGADVVQTDRHYHRLIASGRRHWGLSHWAFVVMSLFGIRAWIQAITPTTSEIVDPMIQLLPTSLQASAVMFFLGIELLTWFLAAGLIMSVFFITGTTEARNHVILNQVEDYIENNPDSSTGCLVVGGAHIPHLKEIVDDSDTVKLGEE